MTRNTVRTWGLLALAALASSCQNWCNDAPVFEPKESYMLAFAEQGSSRIRVRWSWDGLAWNDGNFPDQFTNVGVGAVSDRHGVMRMVLWTDADNEIRALWGFGPTVWDSSPDPASPRQIALSAPSASWPPDRKTRLVAFRTEGDVVALRVFDVEARKFLDFSLAPVGTDAKNDNVKKRPAIVALGNKVLLAWERQTSLQMAVGTISGNIIDWTNKYTFEMPVNIGDTDYSGILGAPTLTHDHNKYYLGFRRGTIGGQLAREDLFVYSSADGISWTLLPEIGIPLYALVNIAARSDGTLIAAVVGGDPANPEPRVYRFSGGSWTEQNAESIFGYTPKQQQFALISAGRPAT